MHTVQPTYNLHTWMSMVHYVYNEPDVSKMQKLSVYSNLKGSSLLTVLIFEGYVVPGNPVRFEFYYENKEISTLNQSKTVNQWEISQQ